MQDLLICNDVKILLNQGDCLVGLFIQNVNNIFLNKGQVFDKLLCLKVDINYVL